MTEIIELLTEYKGEKIALYGLGSETKRFLDEYGNNVSIVGLLDGFKEDGNAFGYPVISIAECVSENVKLIIVVARPGSCKVITKRIGSICIENDIALFDARGRNLLVTSHISYVFTKLRGDSKRKIQEKISKADVISFDLFDTLITRKVFSYTDVFELLDIKLKERDIYIPNFVNQRLYAEKELSKESAPGLEEIYKVVLKKTGGNFISASELSDLEWEIDKHTVVARKDVCKVLHEALGRGKKVVITTDSYYPLSRIKELLNLCEINSVDKVFVSCEQGTSKLQELYMQLKEEYSGKRILHIGDDEIADIKKATEYGIDTCRIYSGVDLFDHLGGLGLEEEIKNLSDKVKVGMFISNLFNSPFWFEEDETKISVDSAVQIGSLFCAPIIADFLLWMQQRVIELEYKQILFCARDGYLPGKLFRKIVPEIKSVYFLSSRTAAIRAGMEDNNDIEYVDSMKYFGTPEEALKKRFGIVADDIVNIECEKEILLKAENQRKGYKKYIENLNLQDDDVGLFDFVAKGTTQMYLQRLLFQHIKGYYFLQLEPEFMSDKGLDIEPFYSDDEKNTSAIFDNYYILETILTSPYSQMEEFDNNGNPVFADETRSRTDIEVVKQMQSGICEYFEEYLALVPATVRTINKKLDEKMLILINNVKILDEEFLALKVEDPFFGRMTPIKDVIG